MRIGLPTVSSPESNLYHLFQLIPIGTIADVAIRRQQGRSAPMIEPQIGGGGQISEMTFSEGFLRLTLNAPLETHPFLAGSPNIEAQTPNRTGYRTVSESHENESKLDGHYRNEELSRFQYQMLTVQ